MGTAGQVVRGSVTCGGSVEVVDPVVDVVEGTVVDGKTKTGGIEMEAVASVVLG